MNFMLLIAVLCIAVATDTRSNRIPNWLTGPALILGLVLSFVGGSGQSGITDALLGALLGFVILMPGYLLGKMGAGDVKLMAVCGSFLGSYNIINAGILTLISGGVLALLWLGAHKLFSVDLVASRADGLEENIEQNVTVWRKRFPYALAIATGNLLVIFTGFNLFAQ